MEAQLELYFLKKKNKSVEHFLNWNLTLEACRVDCTFTLKIKRKESDSLILETSLTATVWCGSGKFLNTVLRFVILGINN